VPNELPPATLRRETVRKAKMGMAARSIFSRYIQPAAPLEIRVDKLMRTELTNRSARSHPSIRRVCAVIIHGPGCAVLRSLPRHSAFSRSTDAGMPS
jgi:hypothetical protein